MVTTELITPSRLLAGERAVLRAGLTATTTLWAVTAAATLAAVADPRLGLSTAPHPALHPTLAAWASILADNARVCALPLLAAIAGFGRGRFTRPACDLAILIVLGANSIRVGLALGRWQTHLLRYLPHLPIEWAALGVAAGAWASARHAPGDGDHRTPLICAAVTTLALLAGAAAIEVLLTPHAPQAAT